MPSAGIEKKSAVIERREKAVRYTISMYPHIISRIKNYCDQHIGVSQSRLIQQAVIFYLDQLKDE